MSRMAWACTSSKPKRAIRFSLGVVIGLPDGLDDRVDVVLGDQQSFQQVSPLLGLLQVKAGAADEDLLLIGDVLVQNVAQGEDAGLEACR